MDYSSKANSISATLTGFENTSKSISEVSFDSVWSGDAYATQTSNLTKTINNINNQISNIKTFIDALNQLQEYKNTKESISSLRSQYLNLDDTPENATDRNNLSDKITSLESNNNALRTSIKNSLSSIGSISTEAIAITYESQDDYKEYANKISDLYNLNKQGKLSLMGSKETLLNYFTEEEVQSEINSIKSQYSGRNAAVNCAVGLMSIAASAGKIISYNLETDTNTTNYNSSNPKTFPLSEVINGTDCSSFVSWAVNQGTNNTFTTKSTKDFKTVGDKISFSKARPGDIIVSNNSHVGLIVENHPEENYFLVAEEGGKEHGLVVQKRPYSSLDNFNARDLSYVYGEKYDV